MSRCLQLIGVQLVFVVISAAILAAGIAGINQISAAGWLSSEENYSPKKFLIILVCYIGAGSALIRLAELLTQYGIRMDAKRKEDGK